MKTLIAVGCAVSPLAVTGCAPLALTQAGFDGQQVGRPDELARVEQDAKK